MHVLCVAGARPNFMKIKPVMEALDARGVQSILIHTGQHYDPALSEVFFAELGLRAPDYHLGVGSGSHAEQTAKVMLALEPLVAEINPDVVVVVGDVNSTVAAALVAAKSPSRLAHVEAGLRSRDRSMPEEVNRTVTDCVSDYLFAPSRDAVDNLRAEGHSPDSVHLVGNVMIDSLIANLERAKTRPILDALRLSSGSYGLVTLHRPANVDDPVVLAALLDALGRIARHVPIVFSAHPRTQRRLERMSLPPGVRAIAPVGYLDFIALEAGASVVLTDSGGIQEETTVLGVPCLTLRDTTERPITVTEGTNRVVGRDPDRIVEEANRVLAAGATPRRPPLWDGRAGERIVDVLVQSAVPASEENRVTPSI
jgi:UDP-N-acetylglucosamine 2-epimerase (non-hydrolysing)